jgi:hypothetical protein
MRRTGLVLSWLVILFCLFDGGARLAGFAPYVQAMPKVGYDVALAPWIGLSLLVSTILYGFPVPRCWAPSSSRAIWAAPSRPKSGWATRGSCSRP